MSPEAGGTAPPEPGAAGSSKTYSPPIGRIVLYRVAENDTQLQSNGIQPGDMLPAVVVRVWTGGTGVNLRVLVDGPIDGWKTSVSEGTTPGTWSWPPIA